jgi:pimeloyl-ACP methyl ester carboxylesterase
MQGQDGTSGTLAVTDDLRRAVERFLTPRPTPVTPRDEQLLRQGTGLFLTCGLAATAWGDGPAVLLAHGWESRRSHWGAFVPALVAAGFRAVAVDAPAHGDSPGKRANALQYGLGLVEVGQEVGPLAGVVGHSFGAAAAAIALHRGLNADRAVLISGPASLVAVIERWGRHHRISEAEMPTFVGRIAREVGVPIESLDLTRLATGLKHPVLVVHDRGDDDIPVEEGLAVAAAWPGARTLVTERYGHRRILIAREVVRAVVGFLMEGDA